MIPELSSSTNVIEILTAIGAFGGVLGLIADHLWVRRRLGQSQDRDDFHRAVESPLREELGRLADFGADVTDWEHDRAGQSAVAIQSSGHRVSRKLNQSINLIAGSRFHDRANWLSLTTDDLDESIAGIDENLKAIHSKTVRLNTDRLEKHIRETLASARV